MRSIHSILFCAAASMTLLPACGGSEPTTEQERTTESGDVRLALTASGAGSGSVHVVATSDASGSVAIDQTIAIQGGTTTFADLTLAVSSYTIAFEVFGGASTSAFIAAGVAHVDLGAGGSEQVSIDTDLGGAGDPGGAGGDGGIDVAVNDPPSVQGVSVNVAGGGQIGLGGLLDAVASIHVDATDSESASLDYFWAGMGLQGAVQGTADASLTAAVAAALSATNELHVVVQDQAGATAAATIQFASSAGCAICGGAQTTIQDAANLTASAQACLSTHAQCAVSCDAAADAGPDAASAHASCLAQCGLDLAACYAD